MRLVISIAAVVVDVDADVVVVVIVVIVVIVVGQIEKSARPMDASSRQRRHAASTIQNHAPGAAM